MAYFSTFPVNVEDDDDKSNEENIVSYGERPFHGDLLPRYAVLQY